MAAAKLELNGASAKRYRMTTSLGSGGMGEVFRGQHVELGREVAIKRLKKELAFDETVLGRFINEARAVNLIRHENIVEVTDFFHDEEGRVHMVMELLEGRSLGALIRSCAPLPFERVAHIGAQIADALAAAHKSGVIHRDLKPENIFLIRRKSTDDYVKLLDFGIARLLPEIGGLEATESGIVMGTPNYMPPEQAKGSAVTAAADTYSFGVILYEMLSGECPFPKTSAIEMMMAHIAEPPRPLHSEGLPAEFQALVESCLAKEPSERPESMAELSERLEEWAVATKNSPPLDAALSENMGRDDTWDSSGASPAKKKPAAQFAEVPSAVGWDRKKKAALIVGLVVAVALGLFLVVRGKGEHKSSQVGRSGVATGSAPGPTIEPLQNRREQLDAVMASMGVPLTPASCQTKEDDVLGGYLRVAELLQGSKPGGNRPQDKLALQEFSKWKSDISPETLFWNARISLVVGDTQSAISQASKASSGCKNFAAAYATEGTALAMEAKHKGAIEQLSLALEEDAEYLDARFNLALSQLALAKLVDAVSSLTQVLDADPEMASARFLRGQLHLQLGLVPEALLDLEMAVKLRRDNSNAWYVLGFARSKSGDSEHAKEAFCMARHLGLEKSPCDEKEPGTRTHSTPPWESDPMDLQ